MGDVMFTSAGPRTRHSEPGSVRRAWAAWVLAALAACTGAAAVLGGVQLVRNGYGMPVSWLSHTPFTSWMLPGIALLIAVALPQLGTAALIVAGARGGIAAGYLAGCALVVWIAVEVVMLQRYQVLQPVVACLGPTEILLAWTWHRTRAQEHTGGHDATVEPSPVVRRR
jgi:hypothetical protein